MKVPLAKDFSLRFYIVPTEYEGFAFKNFEHTVREKYLEKIAVLVLLH